MLRYDRQTKPGLVALYDIQPGNGAGQFLQPRSPHGAKLSNSHLAKYRNKKLVPWGTDGRLPLSGDFRSLIIE